MLALMTLMAFGQVQSSTVLELHREATTYRVSAGLPEQMLDAECCRIAQRWAERMAADRNMRHGGGEQIIARGYRTAASAMRAWMASSGHRAWVLSRGAICGFGAAQDSSGTWYYAGCFRRRSVKVEVERTVEQTERTVTVKRRCRSWAVLRRRCR